MKTVTVRVRERGKYLNASVTLPQDLIKRHELIDGSEIVLCYLCKADENPKQKKKEIKNKEKKG